jgi:hypothetical protein
MKARRVKGLDPAAPLADNAQRIVGLRLEELCDFVPAVLDPARVTELHDMRIAAKRLRYVLEVTAEPCFGPYARTAGKRAKELQDLLGEIHDCDVQLPRVQALVAELRDADADELRRRAGDAPDLDPALAARLPHAAAWGGLMALETYLRARRDLLYGRFTTLWRDLEREGFRPRLEYAIAERPESARVPVAEPAQPRETPVQPAAGPGPSDASAPSTPASEPLDEDPAPGTPAAAAPPPPMSEPAPAPPVSEPAPAPSLSEPVLEFHAPVPSGSEST